LGSKKLKHQSLVNREVEQMHQVLSNNEEWDGKWQSEAASGDIAQCGTQKAQERMPQHSGTTKSLI
jgi:hypothetical protein